MKLAIFALFCLQAALAAPQAFNPDYPLYVDTNAPAPGPDPINSNPAAPGQDQEKKLDCGNGVYTCTSSVCSYYTDEEDNKECHKEQQCCPSGCCTGSSCQGPCL